MKAYNVVKRRAQSYMQATTGVVLNRAGAVKSAVLRRLAVVAALLSMVLGFANTAYAQAAAGITIDPAPIVKVITSGVTVVSAIGMAVLSLVVVIKLFVWVRRTL